MTSAGRDEAREGGPCVVLLYEDPREGISLGHGLAEAGFRVISTSAIALDMGWIEAVMPQAILLAAESVGSQSLGLCQGLRQTTSCPVVMLADGAREVDVVQALDLGVDDFLTRPCTVVELAARLRAIIRRSSGTAGQSNHGPLVFGDLEIWPAEHRVLKRSQRIELSPMEFRLLCCLVEQAGNVLTHQTLMARVWGAEYVDTKHYLRLYIRYLREKIEDDPANPQMILSEWGVGYRFQPPVSAP